MTLAQEFAVFRDDIDSKPPEFGLDYFQTGHEPTRWGQYCSTNRRLQSVTSALIQVQCDLEQIVEDMDMADEGSPMMHRHLWRQSQTLARGKSLRRMFARLFSVCRYLRAQLDDVTDPSVVRRYERELLLEKTREAIAFDLWGMGRITQSTLRGLLALPKDDRVEINAILASDRQRFMNDILNRESIGEELESVPTDPEVERALERDGSVEALEAFGAVAVPLLDEK